MTPETITSRDNPLVKRLRALANDSTAYRRDGSVWLEGDHLLRALLARGEKPEVVVYTEAAWAGQGAGTGTVAQGLDLPPQTRCVVVPMAVMKSLSGLESAPPLGALWRLPARTDVRAGLPTVVLDRLQDPGNVGSVLRSAAAMGFRQVLALRGSAALWAPKVLRAGMGAHFALHLVEGVDADALLALEVPLLLTSSHQGEWLHQAALPWPCAWVLGHEGQGVSDELLAVAARAPAGLHAIRIAQPGGEESLNVAAAAAICLHQSAVLGLGASGASSDG
jgi:RNA methyltransferase, TrmH family